MKLNNFSLAIDTVDQNLLYLCHTCELCAKSEAKSVNTLTNQIVFIYDWLKSQNRHN